jgi:arylsulfatase A-like enzyme
VKRISASPLDITRRTLTIMNFRTLVKLMPVLAAMPLFSAFAAGPKRPNLVLFLTDDQPYGAMSCTGNPVLKTPGMDRLAAEGVLFENSFVTTAICCSSRASIYTGQHMRRHGIEDFKRPLSAAQWGQTFPALLREAGYRTAFLGKFAIGQPQGDSTLALPADKFDLWYGFSQGIAFKQMVEGQPRYLTTVMTEKAVDFIKADHSGRPFCLIIALKEPHGPRNYYDPEFNDPVAHHTIPQPASLTRESFEAMPECVRRGLNAIPEWLTKPEAFQVEMRSAYALIARADLAIAQVCQAIRDQGLDDDTVIIHTSDNGSLDGAHGLEGKWLMYEESIRVPLIIRDPRLPAATRGRRSQMALNIDLAPTILTMAGVPVPSGMQGADLQPILRDGTAQGRQDWYYEHVYTPEDDRRPIPKCEGVRTERWKYIRYTDPSPVVEQLFDLRADPQENHDLARDPEHAATLDDLRRRCTAYRQALR